MSAIVLIVDDDPDLRETLGLALTKSGFHVICARHGQDALDQTRSSALRPSIVLLDLQMPVMDGETLLGLQDSEPLLAGVPVVIMTGDLRAPDPMPSTVRGVLRKPVALAIILEVIRSECSAPRPPHESPLPLATLANGTGSLPPLPDQAILDRPADESPEADRRRD
jgi:CheY-like chemotaxis protein